MIRRLALALVATLVPVLLLELGLRAWAAFDGWRDRRAFSTLASRPAPDPGEQVRLHRMLLPSDNPRLVYRLRPNLAVRHNDRAVSTDARGFRVGLARPGAADREVRIVGLGDSVMFGWGVDDGQDFLSGLERRLGERFPGAGWRAFNLAVPGYNTVMAAEALLSHGLELAPDVVVLSWVNNDLDLPHFLRPAPAALALDRSFAIEWARLRLTGAARGPFEAPVVRPGRRSSRPEVARYLAELPETSRELVGLGAFERALERLAAAADEHDFEIVVVSARGRVPRPVRKRFLELGLPVVSAAGAMRDRLGELGHVRFRDSPLVVSRRDPHPSAEAHQLIADVLARHFVDSGLALRLLGEPETPYLTAGTASTSPSSRPGSTRAPRQRMPKWRCGPVARPVAPTRPRG